MSRIGTVAGQGRETFDGARKEIALSRQEAARHRPTPPEEGLVLDIGSGPAADVRVSVSVDPDVLATAERGLEPPSDPAPPLVVADPEHLPFVSDAFAYVIIDEALAGAEDPAGAAGELARVASGGFVHVPSRASELVFGGPRDRWLIDMEDETFVFSTKDGEPPGAEDASAAFEESLLIRLGWAAHRSRWRHSIAWSGSVPLRMTGPPGPRTVPAPDIEQVLARLEDENKRGRLPFMDATTMDLLRCPASGGMLTRRGRWMDCTDSGLSYPVVGPVPLLLAAAARPIP
jgi:SAM-dependent methyltransferase